MHYIIFQHGVFGEGKVFNRFLKIFSENSKDEISCITLKANTGKTTHGVVVGGRRCFEEIVQISRYWEANSRFSLIGHSMGGNILVYSIYYFVKENPEFFKKFRAENLVLISTLKTLFIISPAKCNTSLDGV